MQTDAPPHPTDRHVGRKLAERRLALGWSQNTLGLALGLTFQQIQKYEKGSNRISASKLWSAAQALEAPITYFFDGLESDAEEAPPTPVTTRQAQELQVLFSQFEPSRQRLVLELARQLVSVK